MRNKPDDYYNNGLFEVARTGNNIILQSIMNPKTHQQITDELVNQCPNIKARIDQLVCKIRDEVLMCRPLELLTFAQLEVLGSMIGVTSESQQIGIEYISVGRMTEYIQSILVSCPEIGNRVDCDQSELHFKILEDISNLFILIINYYVAYWAKVRKEGLLEEDFQEELFEAQLMYLVRGKRYPVFEREYYEQLLLPHSKEVERIFHISSDDIIAGISKLQYALSQGRIDMFNELTKKCSTFLDKEKGEYTLTIKKLGETESHLFESLFGTTLNDVCAITGWRELFVRELSFGLGTDNSFFKHPDYPGWPIIDLPIKKRPFIEIDGKYYCFDYYSFIDNFYRTIQKTVTRLDKGYTWNAIQKEASENMVARLFQSLLPGCTVYNNNYYPRERSKMFFATLKCRKLQSKNVGCCSYNFQNIAAC